QPTAQDLFTVGTRAIIKKMARGSEVMEVLVQGVERVVLVKLEQTQPHLAAQVYSLPLPEDGGTEVEALVRTIVDQARRLWELAQPQAQVNLDEFVAQAGDPLRLSYMFGSMIGLDVPREQALLEAPTRLEALRLLYGYMTHELQVQELRSQIASRAKTEISRE